VALVVSFEPNPIIANGSLDSAALPPESAAPPPPPPSETLFIAAAADTGGTRAFTGDGMVEVPGAALAVLAIGGAWAAAARRFSGGGGASLGGDGVCRAEVDASVLSACAT
jgi:hypothetical protein